MNQETPEEQWKNGWRHWLLIILGFFLLLALVVGVLVAKQSAEAKRDRTEVQRRLDLIRAAGLPMTAQDLAKLYPDPPPEQDASLLLKPALAILSVPDDAADLVRFDLVLPRSKPPDPSVMAEEQQWFRQNQAAFALIPWGQLEHAWIGSGFTNGLMNITQAPLNKMSCVVKLLCVNAILEAEQQHPQDAIKSLQQAAKIANTLKNDLPIHAMARQTADSFISVALERVINRVSLADSDLASIPGFLTSTNIGATKESLLINQRPLALFIANDLQARTSQMTSGSLSAARRLILAFQGKLLYHDADLLHYLKWNDQCLAALESPMSNAIPTLLDLEGRQNAALENKHVGFMDAFKKDRISFITMQELRVTQFLLRELNAVASVRLAAAASAIERWRSAHAGQLPGSTAELVPDFLPAIPSDPFDDQPMRYKKLGKGYVLYSIGEDLTDDGGKEQPAPTNNSDRYDITFTVEK